MKQSSLLFIASIIIAHFSNAFAADVPVWPDNCYSECECCMMLMTHFRDNLGGSGGGEEGIQNELNNLIMNYGYQEGGQIFNNRIAEYLDRLAHANVLSEYGGKLTTEEICDYASFGNGCSSGTCHTYDTITGVINENYCYNTSIAGYQQCYLQDEICGQFFTTNNVGYRCAAGYYGTPTGSNFGCTKCTSPGTSAAGSTRITDCYIRSGTTGSDSTGTFTYTSKCYWSN